MPLRQMVALAVSLAVVFAVYRAIQGRDIDPLGIATTTVAIVIGVIIGGRLRARRLRRQG